MKEREERTKKKFFLPVGTVWKGPFVDQSSAR